MEKSELIRREYDDRLCKLLPDCRYMDPPDGGSVAPIEQVERMIADLQQQVNALAVECGIMRQIIDSVSDLDNEPQYHDEGMGCGLEDRNITDRYEAMQYGWDEAMERVYGEVIPCAEELNFKATDAAIRELQAQGADLSSKELIELAKRSEPNASEYIHASALYLTLIAKQLRNGEQGGDHV